VSRAERGATDRAALAPDHLQDAHRTKFARARTRRDSSRMPAHRLTSQTIDDEQSLRALIGQPLTLVTTKVIAHLTPATRPFIEKSPFLCLATTDAEGHCDVSPRGDPAGFVRILDDRTLLIPERPGNRIADSLTNILRCPRVGLLFIVPGVGDTLRVNGRATLTTDAELLAPCAVEGKAPRLGILVDIEQAYTHCSKAFLRSHFWDPSRFVERSALPSSGELFKCIHGESFDAAEYDRARDERYARREGFY
jgi:PPOX class probable FMN-dependent enzyme